MDKEKIGRFISTLRKERNMTQKDLADKLHVSDRTISKWERGAGLPDASSMITLSDLLGITVNELLSGERNLDTPYTKEAMESIADAASVIYQYVHKQERRLRGRIVAGFLFIAVILCGAKFVLDKVEEDRILFPPALECELLLNDEDVEATLTVDRRTSGVYDYICAYSMDKYGNTTLTERSMWESYVDAVPSKQYKELKKSCPGEITRIDVIETGYLVCSHTDEKAIVLTETDHALNTVFQYELDTREYTSGLSTAFLSGNILYMVAYNSDTQRYFVTSVNKTTGLEAVSSFSYHDFVPDASEEDSMGGFLFDGDSMWVKNGILYFAETYHKGPPASVFGAWDLTKNRAVCFEVMENTHVVMAYKEPDQNQVTVLINPMNYQPLELYTMDDETLTVKHITHLPLPNEYLTRQNSEYAMDSYFLFCGDMDSDRVAMLFGDFVSRSNLASDTHSDIIVVYDRNSGNPVWRGRFTLDADYEIEGILLNTAES